MHNVQRVEQGAHPGVGAPHRHQKTDQESRAQRANVLFGERLDFSLDEVDDACGDNTGQQGDPLWDRMRVGEQTVERDHRRQCREDGQECKKGDAAEVVSNRCSKIEAKTRQPTWAHPGGAVGLAGAARLAETRSSVCAAFGSMAPNSASRPYAERSSSSPWVMVGPNAAS